MKYLGKISNAEFGTVKDYPFLFGLQLHFKFDGGGCSDGGRYTVNIFPDCKWATESERQQKYTQIIYDTAKLLSDAKVNYVSELKGKPVEIEIENDNFKSFRILTEVI